MLELFINFLTVIYTPAAISTPYSNRGYFNSTIHLSLKNKDLPGSYIRFLILIAKNEPAHRVNFNWQKRKINVPLSTICQQVNRKFDTRKVNCIIHCIFAHCMLFFITKGTLTIHFRHVYRTLTCWNSGYTKGLLMILT